MSLTNEQPISYRIDENNTIYWLSENWLHFASLNHADERCLPENVIGKPIQSFIENENTACLYTTIIEQVRQRGQGAIFPFRCDAPDIRRFLEFRIIPLENSHVEFQSEILWSESRETIHLLRPDIERSDETLVICSMCKKAEVEKQWLELEIAIEKLQLVETNSPPTLSHGYCPECLKIIMSSIRSKK